MNLENFFAMGGYAFYVWTSYALVMVILIVNFILPLRKMASTRASIVRMFQHEKKRS